MLPSPASFFIAALNHLLTGADWARQRLIPFAHRQALFSLPPWQFGFTLDERGYAMPVAAGAMPDVTVSLPADAPWRLTGGIEKLMAAAHVSGNAEFATALSFVLRNLRWDIEEDLAGLFGDITAHRVVESVSRLARWQQQAAGNFAGNLAEYLTHESALLVSRQELSEFSELLSRLDASLSGCEQRLRRLTPH